MVGLAACTAAELVSGLLHVLLEVLPGRKIPFLKGRGYVVLLWLAALPWVALAALTLFVLLCAAVIGPFL
jgi:hypothetical protein